ncbi:MAG: iron-containing alcohol dehydrogenase [Thermoleophilaceae bacterium]|nr:iron-containing alcohol dehydrogenase [Thermoleophilaceae bacterium]
MAEALALIGAESFVLLTTERAERPELAERAAEVVHVPAEPVADASAAVRHRVAGRRIVALGGGRVVDAAKAIAGADGLSVAAIPTTLAGSSFTPFHRMPAGFEGWSFVRPSLVVADPALMASMPMPELAATAMNALAHAAESLYMPLSNPVASAAALQAASGVSTALAMEDVERDELALAAFLGGYAIGVTGLGFHHALCQSLVASVGTPHAQTNAVMLAHTIAFVRPRAPEAIGRLDEALGRPLAEVTAAAGPTTLGALGVDAGALPALAGAAVQHPAIGNLPDPAPERAEVLAVLRAAL